MRYFLHIGYDGSEYRGWQRQASVPNTLQQVIEEKVSQICKEKVTIYGCGRTDAGVHASQYIMQINLPKAPDFDLKFRLNKNLPNDIVVFEIFEVKGNQNCRYNAVTRTYDYFVHWKKDPVLMRYSSFYEDAKFDFDLMVQAVALIRHTEDFKPLCRQPDLYNHTLCDISNCELFVNENQGRMRFTITGDRFLRGMVRLCMFFIMEVGSGKLSIAEFEDILKQKRVVEKKQPAFPNGLFLSGITYPFLELQDAHQMIKMLKLGLE